LADPRTNSARDRRVRLSWHAVPHDARWEFGMNRDVRLDRASDLDWIGVRGERRRPLECTLSTTTFVGPSR
jgi:hypothetical protein